MTIFLEMRLVIIIIILFLLLLLNIGSTVTHIGRFIFWLLLNVSTFSTAFFQIVFESNPKKIMERSMNYRHDRHQRSVFFLYVLGFRCFVFLPLSSGTMTRFCLNVSNQPETKLQVNESDSFPLPAP